MTEPLDIKHRFSLDHGRQQVLVERFSLQGDSRQRFSLMEDSRLFSRGSVSRDTPDRVSVSWETADFFPEVRFPEIQQTEFQSHGRQQALIQMSSLQGDSIQ